MREAPRDDVRADDKQWRRMAGKPLFGGEKMNADEARKIVGGKLWKDLCKFINDDYIAGIVKSPTDYDRERVLLFCRLRGVPIRESRTGHKFRPISAIKRGPRKKGGAKRIEPTWDITSSHKSTSYDEENEVE